MSFLTVMLLNILENVMDDVFLQINTYIWSKFDGNRGVHTIASSLLKDFERCRWFEQMNLGRSNSYCVYLLREEQEQVMCLFLVWLVDIGIFVYLRST